MSAEYAGRAVRRRMGNSLATRERSRDIRLMPWIESLWRDVRFGVRVLAKDRVVTVAAVTSLALAIGACTAAFALIDAMILRPLPVYQPDRLFYLSSGPEGEKANQGFSYPALQRLRAASGEQVELFAASSVYPNPAIIAGGQEEKLRNQVVSGNFFSALRIRPALGRLLSPDDETGVNQHPFAVLSYSYWTRRFGGDRNVIGRRFLFGPIQYQIVGVAQKGFTGVEAGTLTDAWMPVSMGAADSLTKWYWEWLRIMGRLQPRVTLPRAHQVLQAAFTNAHHDWAADLYRNNEPPQRIQSFLAEPLRLTPAAGGPSDLRDRFARPMWILALVAGLVLLIACSNLANLFLARAAAREREMALRISIGAGRSRLIQQVIVEGALVAAAACALGLALGAAAAPAIVGMLGPWNLPVYLDVHLGWRMMSFAAAASLAATLLFALAPALRASGVAPQEALKAGGAKYSGRRAILRPMLAAQIALSFAVLFIGGMFVLSFMKLANVDLGFSRARVALLTIARHPKDKNSQFQTAALLERVRGVPGVRSAGISEWSLFSGDVWSEIIRIPGRASDLVSTTILPVSPGFFETMGIRLLAGRDLAARDLETNSGALVVNQAFARHYFPGEQALGKHFILPGDNHNDRTEQIAGIVGDVHYLSVREPAPLTIYLPIDHLQGTLAVRTEGDPRAVASRVRDAVQSFGHSLKVQEVVLQSTLVDDSLIRERLLALLSGFFAIVAAVLAAVGLYGVLSYSLVRRRREIGIRVALGARRSSVVRLVLSDIAVVTALGLAAGIFGGNLLARAVTKLLYEVQPTDMASIALPLGCLLAAAALAGARPAVRAARVDPALALREE
jgi:putative ABC transport system permease protein